MTILVCSVGAFAQTATSSKKKVEINQILGDWKLVDYKYFTKPAKPKRLTACDSGMIWSFYIDDKTKKNLLDCKDTSDSCKDYPFQSDWVLSGSNLIIRRTKIMGFGGVSASGTFIIKNISQNSMVLEFQKNSYVFSR
ncbi:MAG: hypothetical protein RL160_1404 [Bacteroidota bacterium]